MSLEEKAAQLIFPAFRFSSPNFDEITNLIKCGVGGICVFGGSIFDVPSAINSFQRLAKYPLIICSDLEDGAGQQVKGISALPSNMAVGASRSSELSYLKGSITTSEAKLLGINMVLAPVVDVNTNPLNPIINIRSYGEDEELVIEMGSEFIRGCAEAGILTCLKHFPGHGDTAIDSHILLPATEKSTLKPYASIGNTADAVMVGHILAKDIDDKYPSSISKKAVTDTLRKAIGFNGIIITDALIMGGITSKYTEEEAIVSAINAGIDVILFPKEPMQAIETISKGMKNGSIKEATINNAVERILSSKEKVGLFRGKILDVANIEKLSQVGKDNPSAQRIADASITLLKDDKHLLPLKARNICHKTFGDGCEHFLNELEHNGLIVKTLSDRPVPDLCIITVTSKPTAFSGKIGLDETSEKEITSIVNSAKDTIIISFGDPYIFSQLITLNSRLSTLICAYSNCEYSQRATAKALLGSIKFNGKLPITIPGAFSFGSGINP